MTEQLHINGLNRGANAFLKQLSTSTLKPHKSIQLFDPKPHRAERFAVQLERKTGSIPIKGFQKRSEQSIQNLPENGHSVFLGDTLQSLHQTLRIKEKSTPNSGFSYQINTLYDGQPIGYSGRIVPGDRETQAKAVSFFDTLNQFSSPVSSREFTNDSLNMATFLPARETITRQHVRYLDEWEYEPQDLTLSPLTISIGYMARPMIPLQTTQMIPLRQQKQWALDSVSMLSEKQMQSVGNLRTVVVVIALKGNLQVNFFFITISPRGKRYVTGLTQMKKATPKERPMIATD